MSHTNGPWRIERGGAIDNLLHVVSEYRVPVCRIDWHVLPYGQDEDLQAAANAALIAAAPEMYEALLSLVGTLGPGGYFPTAGKTITDKARAALAKASPSPAKETT